MELKGFKSFANDTVIHFSEDVTGIVGPNGSGKSNIVDAMRWVLGEQSSKDLRLEAMSDIIFNGTKKRRKSPYAKVAVVFDNDSGVLPSEFNEVEVQRTLDQDGNSEYFINGVKSRLKDIKSLFADTGIGSNSYAIIALGMVDDILNDTENARRKMFEQAAGISKYKQRKHQSLLKLKSTNADLERIEDLLHEINLNLKALQRQARKARKYLKIRKDYEVNSIKLAGVQSRHIHEKYIEFREAIGKEKEKIALTNAAISKLELEIEELKNKNLEKEVKVSSEQKRLSEIVNTIRKLENDKNITEQRVAFAERQLKEQEHRKERLHERKHIAAEKITIRENVIDKELVELDKLKSTEQAIFAKKEKVEQRMSVVGADRSERLKIQQKLEKSQVQNEKELSILGTRIADIEQRTTGNKEKLDNLKNTIEALEKTYRTEILRIDELEKKLNELDASEKQRKERLKITEEKVDQLKEELNRINRKLDAHQNEYKLLKNLVDKLEGFPESIKFLNKQETWSTSAKLFSDILYCEEKYRTAIENYLEPFLSYYVVPNSEKAYEAIALLKGAQKGKAQFFINAVFEEPDNRDEQLPNMVCAIDIIEVDKQFHPLMASLLKNVYILEDTAEIEKYTQEYPSKIILTQDGTIVKDINKIRGGSSGLFEGKRIGRKKNLEKLHQKIRESQTRQSQKEQELNKLLAEKEELLAATKENEVVELKATLDKEYRSSQQSAIKIENLREQTDELKSYESQASAQMMDFKQKKERLTKELLEISSQLQSMSSDLSDIEGAFTEVNKKVSSLSEKYNQHKIQVIRQESTIERYRQELKNHQEQLAETDKSLLEIKAEKERLTQEKKESLLQITTLRNTIEKQQDLKSVKEKQLNKAESLFFSERKKVRDLEAELKNKQKVLQQHQHLLNGYTEKYTEAKIELSNLAERLKVEFDVSMDALLNRNLEEEVDVEALKSKVEKLRHKKQNFGEVNPMAVQAYEEMKERYDLIVQQKQDVIDAKASLEETIKEIEERATDRFMEAFGQIRENFITVFRTLFRSEDSCDLILEDEENPLDSGINIVARPKGKKPQSLSQLSGGEKTLTATALLFALYLLKPAPFCIFDEVDAPLDDVNIDKFNNIIKDFSSHSQFIIVTHNKMTMAAVDVIYGVYMDEPGISGVSAVDFRHYEDSGLIMSE